MITRENARKYDNALADVLCWLNGIEDAATLMDRRINGVPSTDTLGRLRAELWVIAYDGGE